MHPCLDYYMGAIFMDRGGYKQLLANMDAMPPSQDEVRPGAGATMTDPCCCMMTSNPCLHTAMHTSPMGAGPDGWLRCFLYRTEPGARWCEKQPKCIYLTSPSTLFWNGSLKQSSHFDIHPSHYS